MVKNQRLRKSQFLLVTLLVSVLLPFFPRESKRYNKVLASLSEKTWDSLLLFLQIGKKRKKELICCKHLFLPSAAPFCSVSQIALILLKK